MIRTLFFVAFAFFSFHNFISAQEIKFESLEINYGLIDRGADGERVFKFSNSGNAPLLITDTKASCGCTIPVFSKEPIMPGQTGEIKVKYDTYRTGQFTKQITVSSNSLENSTIRLTINGEVKPDPAATTLTPVMSKGNTPTTLTPVNQNQNNNVLTPVINNNNNNN